MRARIWLTIAFAVLGLPGVAAAHADITGVGVDASGAVRVVLSAPVEEAFLGVDVPGATAARDPADRQAVLVIGAPSGTFRISGLSRDGHAFAGGAVGEAAQRDGLVTIVSEALVFGGLIGLLGLVTMRFWIVGPAWRSGRPRAPGSGDLGAWQAAAAGSLQAAAPGWWRTAQAFLATALVGLVIAPVGLLRDLGAGAGDLDTLLFDTRWGRTWLAVAALLGVTAVEGWNFRRSRAAALAEPPRTWGAALAAPPALGLVAIAIGGHAASGTDAGLGVGLDAAHMIATGIWIGGLAGLFALIPYTLGPISSADGTRLAAAVVVRFSAAAIVCVAVLVVTGVYRAIAELSSVGDLVHTGYGRALLVKLGLFGLLLVGGVYNRLIIHPRLERASLGLRSDDGGARRRLRVSVGAELALAALVVAAVAVLVSFPPP